MHMQFNVTLTQYLKDIWDQYLQERRWLLEIQWTLINVRRPGVISGINQDWVPSILTLQSFSCIPAEGASPFTLCLDFGVGDEGALSRPR
jgi:hypothetical protein